MALKMKSKNDMVEIEKYDRLSPICVYPYSSAIATPFL